MIRHISRKELNTQKYDFCIENSLQSNIFGFSWYLDIVAANWSVFVLNDYEAVMPIPWRKKLGIKYVYQPIWALQLGVFSLHIEDENEFLIELFDDFKYVKLRMNYQNRFSIFSNHQHEKTIQILSLENRYDSIYKNYRRNLKRYLNQAKKNDLTERWNDNPQNLIKLFKKNRGRRKVKQKEYKNLLLLMQICIEKRVGEVLSIYDKNNTLVASVFLLKYKKRVSILISSIDFKKRKNSENTFLIDRLIYKYQPRYEIFDFGNSFIKNIRKYFLSFGGLDEKHQFIKQNKLPKLLRLLKR